MKPAPPRFTRPLAGCVTLVQLIQRGVVLVGAESPRVVNGAVAVHVNVSGGVDAGVVRRPFVTAEAHEPDLLVHNRDGELVTRSEAIVVPDGHRNDDNTDTPAA